MQRNDLLQNGGVIFRVLDVTEDRILVIDCIKQTMPQWIDAATITQYQPATEDNLLEQSEVELFDISDGYASYYCYYDSSADPSKDGVIKTYRDIHLGDSKASVISKYGEANSNTFIMQSNALYQDLLEYSPAEAGIMRSQCSTYIAYAFENLGAIEFYFDENDLVSWIVFYAY